MKKKCIVPELNIIETKNTLSILYCYVEYEKEIYCTIVKHHWDKKCLVNIVLLRRILNCRRLVVKQLNNFYDNKYVRVCQIVSFDHDGLGKQYEFYDEILWNLSDLASLSDLVNCHVLSFLVSKY